MTFPIGEILARFTVSIHDDHLFEKNEEFFLDLEIPPEAILIGAFKGSPNRAKIEIVNDDGKYCIMYIQYTPASTTRVY